MQKGLKGKFEGGKTKGGQHQDDTGVTGCAPSAAYAIKHDYDGGQKVAELRRRKVLWVPSRNPRVRIRHQLRSRQSVRLHQRQLRTNVNGSLVALLRRCGP